MAIKTQTSAPAERYIETTGGRKTAIARARLFSKKGDFVINDKPYTQYFKVPKNQMAIRAPFELAKLADKFSATIKVVGGGVNAQAEAIRNALAKALVVINPELKKILRQAGYVTRDPRRVERKKYGLKKARRAPQWAKR